MFKNNLADLKFSTLFFISLLFLSNCKKEDSSTCVYKELVSESIESNTSNGHKINLSFEAKILANLKKLGNLEGAVKASDSIYANLITEVKKSSVTYSPEFMELHNGVIQLLCDIENQLKDSNLSQIEKSSLLQEKKNLRTTYFNFLLGKKTTTTPHVLPKTDNTTSNNDGPETKNASPKPTPPDQLGNDLYFDQNTSTQIAILAFNGNKINYDLSGQISSTISSQKGFSTNPAFFRSAFLTKFRSKLIDNDASIFQNLGVQDHVKCVCMVNQEKLDIKPNEYENNSFLTASGIFDVSVFYLNQAIGTQTFRISTQGAGANDAMALESLYENFMALFNQKTINLDLCKK